MLVLRWNRLKYILSVWNSLVHSTLWCHSWTTHITCFFLLKLNADMTLNKILFSCLTLCKERARVVYVTLSIRYLLCFVKGILSWRRTKTIVRVIQQWHHKLLCNLPFKIEQINFNILYSRTGMSFKDGNGTLGLLFEEL